MDKETLIRRLMVTFLEEMEVHLAALNRDLLGLEKCSDNSKKAELLKELFRTAHSMKGAARSVNVHAIESACHRLEEILATAQEGKVPVDSDLFRLLFTTADAIEEVGIRIREKDGLDGAPLVALLPKLEAVLGRGNGGLASATASPPAPEPSTVPKVSSLSSIQRTIRRRGAPVVPSSCPVPVASGSSAIFVPPPPPEPVAIGEPSSESATVRVSAEKLDTFLAQSGELLVARRRVRSRVEELQSIRDYLSNWKSEWRSFEKALRKIPSRNGAPKRSSLAVQDSAGGSVSLPRRAAMALENAGHHIRELEKELERLAGNMTGDSRILDQAADSLDAEVRRVRMIPFEDACQGLDRMVRDLAQAGGKEVDLRIEGGKNELDRSVLEGLKDPLRHLVRNAVDHGVEPTEERRAAGKSTRARITIAAVLRGAHVEAMVSDDGRGLNLEALRQQARKRNLPELADDRDLARLIFLPGLSTSQIITDVSGRGVGLDVVKNRVEALHGTVALSFAAGKGTRFTLAVPLTLTTMRVLLVEAGGQIFALATPNVRKLVRMDPGNIRSVGGREMLTLAGPPLPVASLAETLGLQDREPRKKTAKTPALIVTAGDRQMAFVVDKFLAEQEIVVKKLGARIRRIRNISGATILPSGRPALVLNAASLIRGALKNQTTRTITPSDSAIQPKARKRLLVADDSVTTRTLEKIILEAAGYEVAVAADGASAWQLLQERSADLLVSDVDMPRMNGFELTEAVRSSPRFERLPVVLITARETEQDKARGIALGADAYLVKSSFDQKNLLETIAQLL